MVSVSTEFFEFMQYDIKPSLVSLNRLKVFTGDNINEFRELIDKALESLEEAHIEILQASKINNVIGLRAAVHKVTPLFHYLEAERILNIINCCVQSIIKNTAPEMIKANYQVILKTIRHAFIELTEKARQEGL